MKVLILLLGLINGGYMFVDGVYVMLNGKYIGPAMPGPWARIFYQFDINVFQLGPMFIVFGLAWLIFVLGFLTNQLWAYSLGIFISILSVWYLPVGTIISLIVLIILLTSKPKLGL